MIGVGWRMAREKMRVSLRSVASAVGISAPFLSDIEHGRRSPGPEVEDRLRAHLGMPPRPKSPPRQACVVCGADLSPKVVHHATIDDPNGVIGPGYRPLRSAYAERDGYTCSGCGLHYDTAPHQPRHDSPAQGGHNGEH